MLFLNFKAIAQDKKEKRVYYLDCSGSMVSSKGNIWSDVKTNLKSAISSVSDETTELLVIPFAFNTSNDTSKPLNGVSEYATEKGKERLKQYIDNLPTPNEKFQKTKTFHNMPISDFVNYRIDKNKESYMFLMTDGIDEDNSGGFENIVQNWDAYSSEDVYGIYVMLKGDIDSKRKDLIEKVDYFWWATTADVNINTIKLDKKTIFNIRNDKKIEFKYKGNLSGLNLKFCPDDSVPFNLGKVSVVGNKINIEVSIKEGTNVYALDESKLYPFKVKAIGGDEFSILLTPKVIVNCISKRENSLSVIHNAKHQSEKISMWEKIGLNFRPNEDVFSFGTVEYYPSFLWRKDSIKPVKIKFSFEFNKDAKLNNEIYAKFQFVDNGGNPFPKKIFTVVDGTDTLNNNILTITNRDSIKNLKFYFSPSAESSKYQGYFRLINHNLDRIDSHLLEKEQVVDVFQWTIHYEKHINPLLLNIIWILLGILLLICLLSAIIFTHRLFMKKFPKKWGIAFRSNRQNIELRPNSCHQYYYRDKENKMLVNSSPTSTLHTYVLHSSAINKIVLNEYNSSEIHHIWKGDTIKIKTDFKNYNISKIVIEPKGKFAIIVIYDKSGNQITYKLRFKQATVGETENIEIDKYSNNILLIYGWVHAKGSKNIINNQ